MPHIFFNHFFKTQLPPITAVLGNSTCSTDYCSSLSSFKDEVLFLAIYLGQVSKQSETLTRWGYQLFLVYRHPWTQNVVSLVFSYFLLSHFTFLV